MVIRQFVFYNITPTEQFSNLIYYLNAGVLFDYQKVNLQRLRIKIIFFFINEVTYVFR